MLCFRDVFRAANIVGGSVVQRRRLGHIHPSLGKGLGITSGRQTIIANTRIERVPGQSHAGTFVSLGPMGSPRTIALKNFAQYAESPFIRWDRSPYPKLLGNSAVKAIINKLMIKKPRRPNSGKILCCSATLRRPSIRTGEPVMTKLQAHIGYKGAPLREYSVVEVRKKHKRGVTLKYFCKWGKYDFPAKPEATRKKKKYEGKMGY